MATPQHDSSLISGLATDASRRRLISFRVSDAEYAALKELSGEQGSRSLSDFVRTSVCAILRPRKPWELEAAWLAREFGWEAKRLTALSQQLGNLLQRPSVGEREK